jgi:hypothetical protein
MPDVKKSASSADSRTQPLQALPSLDHLHPEGVSAGETVVKQPPAHPALKTGAAYIHVAA